MGEDFIRDENGDRPVWETASGQELFLEDMTLSHLRNARNYVELNELPFPNLGGEIAQEAAEHEYQDRGDMQAQWLAWFDEAIAKKEALAQ